MVTYAKSHDSVVYERRVIKEQIRLVCNWGSAMKTIKQRKGKHQREKKMDKEPSSNPTPRKQLHRDRLPPQHTIIPPHITNPRHNTPPSPHSVPMAITDDHYVRLTART